MKKFKHTKVVDQPQQAVKSGLFGNKKTLWILAGLIIFLMVGSALTIMFSDDEDNSKIVEYNGHKFIYDLQGGWTTIVNGQKVGFDVLPTELEPLKNSFYGLSLGKTYVSFNPREFSENSYEISRILSFLAFTGRQAFPSCSSAEGCGDLPIVNCTSNITQGNVIYFYTGNDTRIEQEDNCLKLEARPGEELKVASLFIYKLLGIMN